MHDDTTASYTKLREGDWGLRVSSRRTVQQGDTISVQTKAGKIRSETVDRVIWSGADRDDPSRTVFLCLPQRQAATTEEPPPNTAEPDDGIPW